MNIFKKIRDARNRKKIQVYTKTLGHVAGWNIDSSDIEDLFHRDPKMFSEYLTNCIESSKHKFMLILDIMSHQCHERGIPITVGETMLSLLGCNGSKILITDYDPHTCEIRAFKLIYPDVTGVSKVATKLFNSDTFATMVNDLLTKFDNADQRLWTVRRFNWMFCTINDIDYRIKNWKVFNGWEVKYNGPRC